MELLSVDELRLLLDALGRRETYLANNLLIFPGHEGVLKKIEEGKALSRKIMQELAKLDEWLVCRHCGVDIISVNENGTSYWTDRLGRDQCLGRYQFHYPGGT